jgi:Zn-dependent protease with chaperone function
VTTDPLVPLLLPLAAWPIARLVAPRLPPRVASWLLTGACLVLAAGSTAALMLLAFAGLSLVPAVADAGRWSPHALRDLYGIDVPVSVAAGVLLMVLAGVLVRTVVRHVGWARRLSRELDVHSRDGGVVPLPGDEPLAFAAPGRGGRIAISRGMLAALTPRERCALLAHERAHLALRHHVFLIALRVAGLSAQTALDSAADLHDGIELAQTAAPFHHGRHHHTFVTDTSRR